MSTNNIIDGFTFADEADVAIAEEEIKRIKYITSKMNMNNAKGVLAVYDKLVTSGIFVTPVGYEYLRTLQNFLYKSSEIPDEAIREIPIPISYSNALSDRNKERERRQQEERNRRTLRKTFKNEYKVSLIINIILFVVVVALFIITLKAENPNMLNYRTAIINQYSDWEQDLTNREEAVRAKELEYGMYNNDSETEE